MAQRISACVESCRAASLAAHSAAGLCTSLRKDAGPSALTMSEAARMLRSAEALARAACAALTTMQSSVKAGKTAAKPEAAVDVSMGAEGGARAYDASPSRPRRRRRNRKTKTNGATNEAVASPGNGTAAAAVVATGAEELLDDTWADTVCVGKDGKAGRRLLPKSSRERTPPPRARKVDALSVGDKVLLHGLVQRFELNGKAGELIDAPGRDGRRAVRLDGSGVHVWVNSSNLSIVAAPSDAFSFGPASLA